MCLRIYSKKVPKPRRVWFRKVVYKHLSVENGKYMAPVMDTPVDVTKEYIAKTFKSFKDLPRSCGINCWAIGEGAIHVYENYSFRLAAISNIYPHKSAYFKCIIPRGTLYYKDKLGHIAAQKIKFIEQF